MGLNQEPPVALPDIDSLPAESWPQHRFPIRDAGPRNSVEVVCTRSALNALYAHGASRTDVEVCGVLVGRCCRDERGPYLYVEATIQGEHADHQAAQVTFTADTWSHIQQELDLRHPGKQILGWYHTHPGFGIFLSPMDLFIHEHFFNSNEQLAFVYDPLQEEEGLFVWRQGRPERQSYLIEEDAEQRPPGSVPRSLVPTQGDLPQLSARELGIRTRQRRWAVLCAVLLFVTVAGIALCWRRNSMARPTPAENIPTDMPSIPEGAREDLLHRSPLTSSVHPSGDEDSARVMSAPTGSTPGPAEEREE